MPRKTKEKVDKSAELLEKILVLQLHSMGVTQDRIGKVVGRQKAWVNSLVRGIPKGVIVANQD